MEEAILGAIMLEEGAFATVSEILKAENFYKEAHQEVFKAAKSLDNSQRPIDIMTVVEELRKNGKLEMVGGAYAIAQMTSRIASAANIEHHSRVIFEHYLRRLAIVEAARITSNAYDLQIDLTDLFSSIITMEDKVVNFASESRQILDFGANVAQSIDQVKTRAKNALNGKQNGLPSKLNGMNKITNGYHPGDLIIIAGRPGMGKTAFAVCEAKHMAQNGHPVLFFSLEMSSISLTDRIVIAASGVNADDFRSGMLTHQQWDALGNCHAEIANLPIYIDDTPYVSINHIRRVSKVYKQKGKCAAIMVDYLQLANMDGGDNYNREQEVANMTRRLKSLAKELEVPVFVLSQLSRQVENRPDKKPKLSDLRESGAIEQDADKVFFTYRPSYYYPDDPELKNIGSVIIAKHRAGPLGDVYFQTNNSITDFWDIENNNNNAF